MTLSKLITFFLLIFFSFLNEGNSKNNITECEKLADDPKNPDSKTKGVKLGEIKFNKAITSCETEISKNSKSIFHYNLSRAYIIKSLNQNIAQKYEKQIIESFNKAVQEKKEYYKLKFAEILTYPFLVKPNPKKSLKLVKELSHEFFDSYESKNFLLARISEKISSNEEYKNEINVKNTIKNYSLCIKEKEPNFMFCKYSLSDFYLMDHDFYSEDKSYFYLSDNLNSRLNKELLIKNYYWGWFGKSPPVDELLNDLKQLIETEYDNNDFDSYNPYAFNKIFRIDIEADPYVILGEYSLINKNYEDGFNFFKKAFEIIDQINLSENFNNVDFEWIKYNFETSLATLYFLSKKKIRDEKVFSADYLWEKISQNISEQLYLNLVNFFNNKTHKARDYDEMFKISSFFHKNLPENTTILNYMGLHYAQGFGVKTDYSKAISFYLKAYKNGDSYAANNLGWETEKGEIGDDPDYKKAVFYYEEAIKLDPDNYYAPSNLGRMYMDGLGVEENLEKAKKLFYDAHILGNIEATYYLAKIYSESSQKNSLHKAIEILEEVTKEADYYYQMHTDDGMQKKINANFLKKLKQITSKDNNKNKNVGKRIALLIGNNNYKNFQNLRTPINDITSIAEILKKKYFYDTKILKNASRRDILLKFNELKNKLNKNDHFVLYYAGHGIYDKDTNLGYWLPVNAEPNIDIEWISNSRITNFIKSLKSSKVLLLIDSCYSGTIFRGVNFNDGEVNKDKSNIDEGVNTRLVITSGGNEPVVDGINTRNSIFSLAVQDVLKTGELITASNLFDKVKSSTKEILIKENIKQTPQYAPLVRGGHIGGDFYFTAKK